MYSDFYEKEISIGLSQANILFDIYIKVMHDMKQEPELLSASEIIDDPCLFDHVAYHVENFGKKYNSYKKIKNLFE